MSVQRGQTSCQCLGPPESRNDHINTIFHGHSSERVVISLAYNSRIGSVTQGHGRPSHASSRRISRFFGYCFRSNSWVVGRAPVGCWYTSSQCARATESTSHRQPFWIRPQHADGRICNTCSHSRPIQCFHKFFRVARWNIPLSIDNLRSGTQVARVNRRMNPFYASPGQQQRRAPAPAPHRR